jgi:hypothetical protein
VCAVRSSENADEDNIEEWIQSKACELVFCHMSDIDIVHAAA